jgi:hypothetical protein
MPDETNTPIIDLPPEALNEFAKAVTSGEVFGKSALSDEDRKSLSVRIVMWCGRSLRRALEYGRNIFKDVVIGLVLFAVMGSAVLLFAAFVQYLFTINAILAYGVIGAAIAQITMTGVAYLARMWVERPRLSHLQTATIV